MIRFAVKSQGYPIGLDVGHDSVKMLQLGREGDRLHVVAAARVPLAAEVRGDPARRLPAAADAVRRVFAGRASPFHGRRVVTALPRGLLHSRNVRVPPVGPGDLHRAVRDEAAGTLPFEWDDAVTHCLPAGEVRQGGEVRQEVVFLAAGRRAIDEHVEIISRGGVELAALDAEPLALYRSVERFVRRQDDRRDVNVLIDVGWDHTHVVMGRGWDVQFVRTIPLAARHFQEAIARKLGITPDEAQALRRRLNESEETIHRFDPVRVAATDAARGAMEELSREVAMCLRYHAATFRGQRQGAAKVFGGEAADAQLLAVLARSLPVPVQPGRPLFSVDTSRMPAHERTGPMSEWAMAFGLALKTIDERFGPRDGKPRESVAPGELAPAAAAPVLGEVARA